jgi:hypothetical protein
MKIKQSIIILLMINFIISARVESGRSLEVSTNVHPVLQLDKNSSINLIKESTAPMRKSQTDEIINTPKRTDESTSTATKIKDYFQKTSKDNRNTALGALGVFIGGIILFLLSIQLICWNERRSVRDTELLDYYGEKKCYYVENGFDIKIDDNIKQNLFIVNGTRLLK